MSKLSTISCPDIGDFQDVAIIEVLAIPGSRISPEDPIVSIESDKATMDIPAPVAGKVIHLHVRVGDRISKGSPLADIEVTDDIALTSDQDTSQPESPASFRKSPTLQKQEPVASFSGDVQAEHHCHLLVLGSGPGGYAAAFRAADLGMDVIMVERYPEIGGVCLNVGCIPSKALLHAAEVIEEAERFTRFGIQFGEPKIDLAALRQYKEGVVGRLTQGLRHLSKQRKIRVLQGEGRFSGSKALTLQTPEGLEKIAFEYAIIAVGSRVVRLPEFPWDDPRVMDSTAALDLDEIPARLLVIGGGVIGLEMACVYDALGSKVTVLELSDTLMPGADRDIVRPLEKRIRNRYENIFLQSKVVSAVSSELGIEVHFSGQAKGLPEKDVFDRVLVAVGRRPNGDLIHAEAAGIRLTGPGFIEVDNQQRTNIHHIFAIGDVVGDRKSVV